MDITIQEGNKLIAEFMGFAGYQEKGHINPFGEYHSSWDWLMPVWKKFVAEYHNPNNRPLPERKLRSEFADAAAKVDIEWCWEILVTGILWYNSLPTTIK